MLLCWQHPCNCINSVNKKQTKWPCTSKSNHLVTAKQFPWLSSIMSMMIMYKIIISLSNIQPREGTQTEISMYPTSCDQEDYQENWHFLLSAICIWTVGVFFPNSTTLSQAYSPRSRTPLISVFTYCVMELRAG